MAETNIINIIYSLQYLIFNCRINIILLQYKIK